MTIKLRGSTDGSVSLTAPADTSPTGTDITLTLPTDAGSANQFIKNSGTAGTLDYSSMVETSTGVGIGTSSPASILHVNPSADCYVTLQPGSTDGNAGINIRNSADTQIGYVMYDTDDNYLRFGTDNTERMRIDSSGVVKLTQSGNNPRFGSIEASGDAFRLKAFSGNASHNATMQFFTGADSPTERMRIDSSGRVGIGTTSPGPDAQLEVDGGSDGYASLRLRSDGGGSNSSVSDVKSIGTGSNQSALTFFTRNTSLTEHFRIAHDGTLTATDTSIGSNSDSRLKTNIADFAYDLEAFKQYQPKTFDWKNPELHGNKTGQRGFIAQDVEAIDSYWVGQQAVDEDNADTEFLDADRLVKTLKLGKKDAMYVSVIQQLLAKIETLETKVAALEAA